MNKVIKKKHHYVWKHYLKPWTNNKKICCLRNGKMFSVSLENIAHKRYFYESKPITDFELNFINTFLNQVHPSSKESLSGLLELYIKSTFINEYTRKSGIEDFHSIIEEKFVPILNQIYNNDYSFLNNDEERGRFSFFVGSQYTRTNKMRDNFINAPFKVPLDLDLNNLSNVFSLFFSDLIGNWIFKNGKISLLRNNTDLDFITGDQPVINTKGDIRINGDVQEFDLYFPISPKLAIRINDHSENEEYLNKKTIGYYNGLIKSNSKEQIFSTKIEAFDFFR